MMEKWKEILPAIARMAIEEAFGRRRLDAPFREELISRYPRLAEPGAVFVTLKIDGRLRGCIGSLLARRPLIDDVIENARAAAFHDSRFPPLSANELPRVDIEISLLSEPAPLPWTDIDDLRRKIIPGEHGVILRLDGRRATFLPSVWEQLPDFDTFFAHLCRKAGLEPTCLTRHPEIFTYVAEKITE